MPPTPPKDTLEPLPEKGAAPRRRIPTAQALNAIHQRYLREDEQSSRIRAIAQSLIDNIAPYDPAELVEKGLGDMTNVNFGESESELTAALAPFVEIIEGVPRVADVILENDDPIEKHEKSERVSQHFDKMLKDWDDFFPEVQRLAHFFVKDGLSVGTFRNERTWQWEAVPLGEFLTDRDTPTSDQRIEVATIYREIPVSRLYRYIEDVDSAKKAGWNPAMVRKAIWESSNNKAKWKD